MTSRCRSSRQHAQFRHHAASQNPPHSDSDRGQRRRARLTPISDPTTGLCGGIFEPALRAAHAVCREVAKRSLWRGARVDLSCDTASFVGFLLCIVDKIRISVTSKSPGLGPNPKPNPNPNPSLLTLTPTPTPTPTPTLTTPGVATRPSGPNPNPNLNPNPNWMAGVANQSRPSGLEQRRKRIPRSLRH